MEVFKRGGWMIRLCALCLLSMLLGRAATAQDRCETKLLQYGVLMGTNEVQLRIKSASGGELLYFGAVHSRDPQSPQFKQIDENWTRFKPTVAFYEGPNRPIEGGREQVIQQTGESGYVRFLAARDGTKLARLEPDPKDEFEFVQQKFPQEQVELFYFLRQAAQLRERQKMDQQQVTAAISQMLGRVRQLGIPIEILSTDALQEAYAKYFSSPINWWEAPLNWFTPNPEDERKNGGKFFHAINRWSSEFRDVHMYRVLSEMTNKGERVFAVVGAEPCTDAGLGATVQY